MKAKIPELPEELQKIQPSTALLHEVVTAELANRRQSNAHTKTRRYVSGGGKKPWRQKGTGRARTGSNRSPIWKGGGVTFGPSNERNYKQRLPRKKRRAAALQALVQRLSEGSIMVVDNVIPEQIKTRLAAQMLADVFPEKGLKVLIVADDKVQDIRRAYGNIEGVSVAAPASLNALRIISSDRMLFTESAWVKCLKDKSGVKEK